MAKASKAKQIVVTVPNRVGALARISNIISGVEANISAISARGDKRRAYFHILVDRHIRVRNALLREELPAEEEGAILLEMPNKPGRMQKVAEKIAEAGIDIQYTYGSAGSGRTSFCVLKTNDDKKALKIIKGK